MKLLKVRFRLPLLAIAALLLGGCLLSGTFTIVEQFSFTTASNLYHYLVDVTDQPDWEDHADDIDQIDLVGFELWITNHQATEATFGVYLDDASELELTTIGQVQAEAVQVFGNLTVAAGPDVTTHVTYGESLGYIRNVAELRRLVKEGTFHYYGISTGGDGSSYTVDSVKVVITFSASGS